MPSRVDFLTAVTNSAGKLGMGSREECLHWCVFDGVKKIATEPEALMSEVNSAMSVLEYSRATAYLETVSFVLRNKNSDRKSTSQYDVRRADEAYKEGMAAKAAGKFDEAIHSLNVALSECPPDKTSAIVKLQSLISTTSQELGRTSN